MTFDIEKSGEREMLEAHLEDTRETVVAKCAGISESDARRKLGPSNTSVAGILKHLTNVERWWFRRQLAGEDEVPMDWNDTELDLEFIISDDETIESLLTLYAEECDRSRQIAAGLQLDDLAVRANPHGKRPSLRWVYLHMIDENARHNGHLDIYRELLDGYGEWDTRA